MHTTVFTLVVANSTGSADDFPRACVRVEQTFATTYVSPYANQTQKKAAEEKGKQQERTERTKRTERTERAY